MNSFILWAGEDSAAGAVFLRTSLFRYTDMGSQDMLLILQYYAVGVVC